MQDANICPGLKDPGISRISNLLCDLIRAAAPLQTDGASVCVGRGVDKRAAGAPVARIIDSGANPPDPPDSLFFCRCRWRLGDS